LVAAVMAGGKGFKHKYGDSYCIRTVFNGDTLIHCELSESGHFNFTVSDLSDNKD